MSTFYEQARPFIRSVRNWGDFRSLTSAKALIRCSARACGVPVSFGRQVKDGSTPDCLTYVDVRLGGGLMGELVRGPDGWRYVSP